MPLSSTTKIRRLLQSLEDGAELDAAEQDELAIKIKYGVLDEIFDRLAASAPEELPTWPEVPARLGPPPARRPAPATEAARRAAVQRLGRGHRLGRGWR